jgi:ionotropic glutamate receptor
MDTFHQNLYAHSTPSLSISSPSPYNPSPYNLKIGVPWKTEFTEFVTVRKDITGFNITGFCVEVFNMAIDTLNIAAPVQYSVQYIPFGDGINEPNYDDLIGGITAGKFDAVVGDVTITAKRAEQVQFTQPFLDSGLLAVVRLRNVDNINSGFAFLMPFSIGMWLLTLGFFTTGVLALYLLEYRRNSASRQFGSTVWTSFSTLITNQNDIKTVMGRIVFIAWLFVGGTLYSCYTANLSAILTAPRLEPTLNDIQSVVNSGVKIGIQKGSFADNYLNQYFHIDEYRLKLLNTEDEYFNALFNGKVDALIDERPYMESLAANHCCKLTFAGKTFTTQNWGFAFHHRLDELAQNISNIILNLSDTGTILCLRTQWLPYYHEDCSGYTQSETGQIQVPNAWGLFLVSGLVTVIVLLIYMGRWKWKASRVAQQTPLPVSFDHGQGF